MPESPSDSSTSTVPKGVRDASEWAARLLVIGLGVYVFGRVLGHMSEIVIPVLIAMLLAALLEPLCRRLARHLPRAAAAGVTVIGTLTVIAGLMTFVGTQFTSQFSDIVDQTLEGVDQIRNWIRDTFHVTDTQFAEYYQKARDALSGSGNLGETAAAAGLTVTHVVAGFFIVMFTLFFFLFDGKSIWTWIVRLFPSAARAKITSSGAIAWGQLQAFCRATMLVAAADATGIGLGAFILGVPFATGIALLVFLGAFVPVVGALVSGIVAVLLALVAKGPITALIMLGVVVAVQQIEAHVMQPFLLGRAVRVHPLAVILAIAGGVVLWGIVGALIAVPVAAVSNAVGNHLLAESEPAPSEPEALLSPEEEADVARDIDRAREAEKID